MNNAERTLVQQRTSAFGSRKLEWIRVASALFSERDRVPELASQYLDFARDRIPNQYDEIAKRLDQILSIASSEK
jgi:hypothetical protein